GVAGDATDVVRIFGLRRRADHVDDDAGPALFHQRIKSAAHVDVAEHLEVPGRAPALLVDLDQVAARNGAGVVDENVDAGKRRGDLVDVGAVGEIGGENVDPHVRLARDLGLRGLEVGGGAGDQHHVAAFFRHGVGGGAADALGGAGDEGRLAGELEVHGLLSMIWRG